MPPSAAARNDSPFPDYESGNGGADWGDSPVAPAAPIAVWKSREAVSAPAGRFDAFAAESFDDGWNAPPDDNRPPPTEVFWERARSLISKNDSPDIPYRYSVNPYRGCEHGCVYCFARPAHAYLGLSPGQDFETKIFSKQNAA